MQKGDKLQVKFHIDWKINVLVYLVLNDKEISKSWNVSILFKNSQLLFSSWNYFGRNIYSFTYLDWYWIALGLQCFITFNALGDIFCKIHSIYFRTVSSYYLLSALVNKFRLVYGPFMHCIFNFCPDQISQEGIELTKAKE